MVKGDGLEMRTSVIPESSRRRVATIDEEREGERKKDLLVEVFDRLDSVSV
jgi:hypothetical protein